MEREEIRRAIEEGNTALGIELGSTRIKAVLIGPDRQPAASGDWEWHDRLENGIWTYSLEDAWEGVRGAYRALSEAVKKTYGVPLKTLGALGVSAMMHGYLVFDEGGAQLAEFRTWRNTVTEAEAAELTELFRFNIPQRWSVAHLYRAVRRGEAHVGRIAFLTTLEGYIHWKLTGEKVIGVGEAAGMFPIDAGTGEFDREMLRKFRELLVPYRLPWAPEEILPKVLAAGEPAGCLTEEGARLLDPEGVLQAGIPFCPPEGDAGTGMTATNSVSPRTGNVSAGTSVFAMVVLEKPLKKPHPEIDMVATPAGLPVAMVHCNTCSSDLDAWVGLFGQLLEGLGTKLSKNELYTFLYRQALEGAPDCGGLLTYNCYSGEPVMGLERGVPLFTRRPDRDLSLPDFMRAQLFAALAGLRLGMEILLEEEKAPLDKLYGHGGFFKTKGVGQKLMAGALNVPVEVLRTAGEGGPWGMALLAMYRKEKEPGESLESYLAQKVFCGADRTREEPDETDRAGFEAYLARYQAGMAAERAAADALL